MRPLPRPCLDCGTLHTNQSRCTPHQRANRTPSRGDYNDPVYKRNRRRLLQSHIRSHGYQCLGDGHDSSRPADLNSNPLTIDHKTPVSAGGGNELSNLQVLCQVCNTRKGGTNRDR